MGLCPPGDDAGVHVYSEEVSGVLVRQSIKDEYGNEIRRQFVGRAHEEDLDGGAFLRVGPDGRWHKHHSRCSCASCGLARRGKRHDWWNTGIVR